jgi:hypothetical protein
MMTQQARRGQLQLDQHIRRFAEAVYEQTPEARTIRVHAAPPRLARGEGVRVEQAILDFVGRVRTSAVPVDRSTQQIATFVLADHAARECDLTKRLPHDSVFALVRRAMRGVILDNARTRGWNPSD